MKNRIVAWVALLFPAFLLAALPLRQELTIVHGSVGETIDADEAKKLVLIDAAYEVIAARVYSLTASSWTLHISGVRAQQPWFLIKRLTRSQFLKLQNRASESQTWDEETAARAGPLFKIDPEELMFRGDVYEIKLIDSSKLYGTLLKATASNVDVNLTSGLQISLPDEKIISFRQQHGQFSGEKFMRQDPNHIRLFLAPTGRTLRKGQGNFSDFYIFFPSLAYGFTDYFTVGGGISIVPGVGDQLVYISPKFRVLHRNKVDAAVGLLHIGLPSKSWITTVYSALSVGDPLGGFTFGLGLPVSTEFAADAIWLTFGAEKQVTNNVKLITENWLFTVRDDFNDESLLLLSGGIRFIADRLTVGFAFYTTQGLFEDGDGFPFLPWLDFSLNFGK